MNEQEKKFIEIEKICLSVGWSDSKLFQVLASNSVEDDGTEADEKKAMAKIKKQFQRKSPKAPLDLYLKWLSIDPDVVSKLGVKPIVLETELSLQLERRLVGISKQLSAKLKESEE